MKAHNDTVISRHKRLGIATTASDGAGWLIGSRAATKNNTPSADHNVRARTYNARDFGEFKRTPA
ncbi:MAG TPA: hypothetical protein VJX16_24885 [Terriglobales bacterium]|nr:hypothetical protein [Terriglobales bacterium]